MNMHGNPTWNKNESVIVITIDSDTATELLDKFKKAGVNAESIKNFTQRDEKEITQIEISIEEDQKALEVYRRFTADKG